MTMTFLNFNDEAGFSPDFHRVRDFLVRLSREKAIVDPFEWGRWEWAFSLPFLDTGSLSKIGLWSRDGELVGLATYEDRPGRAWFCVDPACEFLKAEMLAYARGNLADGEGKLLALINNADLAFQRIALKQGFTPTQEREPDSRMDIELDKLVYSLPPGYRLVALSEGVDLVKFNRVLWRGFNHPGEPPESERDLEERRVSISGPHLNLDLCMVAVAPDGNYAAYSGLWYDPNSDYALVEPVATDPDHRRLGLGRAVVLEAVRRAARLGARQAYVGSDQQFYYQIGFHPLPAGTFWEYRG
jgi:GNAT superfamily N-acetyltransferase